MHTTPSIPSAARDLVSKFGSFAAVPYDRLCRVVFDHCGAPPATERHLDAAWMLHFAIERAERRAADARGESEPYCRIQLADLDLLSFPTSR